MFQSQFWISWWYFSQVEGQVDITYMVEFDAETYDMDTVADALAEILILASNTLPGLTIDGKAVGLRSSPEMIKPDGTLIVIREWFSSCVSKYLLYHRSASKS